MLTHNTQSTDILALTAKLIDSHLQPYLYSLAPAPYLKGDFLQLTGFSLQTKHTNYYHTLTYHIVQKCCTFQDYPQHKILLMIWYGPHVFTNFYIFHPHFHNPILHPLSQPITVQ